MEKAYSLEEALTKPESIERLVLKYGKHVHAPLDSRIIKLSNLKELYFEDYNLSLLNLPREIRNIQTLESISLQFSQELIQLPEQIFEIPSLKRISTAGLRKINSISDKIIDLKSLTNLTLGFELNHIPKGLLSMNSILGLDLCLGDINDKSAIIENYGDGLKHLGSLNLIVKKILDIPQQLFYSTEYNNISILCNDGSNLMNFRYSELEKLSRLKLSNFKNIDSRINKLTNLKTLDLYGFKNNQLNVDFSNFKNLEFLEISNSSIHNLDESIIGAFNLKRIILTNSKIKRFPIELSKLDKLKGIDLQNCENLDFDTLYNVVKESSSMNWLKLKGTNLSDYQKSKINKELKKNE